MNNQDDTDTIESNGIFGSDAGGLDPNAIQSVTRIQNSITKDGYKILFPCPGCSRQMSIMVEYPEIVAMANKIAPQLAGGGSTWNFDQVQGAFYPHASCSTCGSSLPVMVSPAECQRVLKSALESGALPTQVFQQYNVHMQRVKQQYGGG